MTERAISSHISRNEMWFVSHDRFSSVNKWFLKCNFFIFLYPIFLMVVEQWVFGHNQIVAF